MTRFRAVRVATAPIELRFAGVFGRLVNISASGALVRIDQSLSLGCEWPLRLNLESGAVELRARVVRSKPVPVQLAGAAWQREEYVLAVKFTDLPPQGKEAIAELCRSATGAQES